jgi:hypothetical protein
MAGYACCSAPKRARGVVRSVEEEEHNCDQRQHARGGRKDMTYHECLTVQPLQGCREATSPPSSWTWKKGSDPTFRLASYCRTPDDRQVHSRTFFFIQNWFAAQPLETVSVTTQIIITPICRRRRTRHTALQGRRVANVLTVISCKGGRAERRLHNERRCLRSDVE